MPSEREVAAGAALDALLCGQGGLYASRVELGAAFVASLADVIESRLQHNCHYGVPACGHMECHLAADQGGKPECTHNTPNAAYGAHGEEDCLTPVKCGFTRHKTPPCDGGACYRSDCRRDAAGRCALAGDGEHNCSDPTTEATCRPLHEQDATNPLHPVGEGQCGPVAGGGWKCRPWNCLRRPAECPLSDGGA